MTQVLLFWTLLATWLLGWGLCKMLQRALVRWGWKRENYQGRTIPRGTGLAVLLGAAPGGLVLAALAWPAKAEAAALGALVVFALLGAADDAWGDRGVGGLKGHFRALLRERRLTTGAAKALLGSAAALCLGFWLSAGSGLTLGAWAGRGMAAALLIALMANALNLLDTRPCRSLALYLGLEALLLPAQGLLGWPRLWNGAVTAAAALPLVPSERRRESMMGDTGANLLGAVLGVHLAATLPLAAQWVAVGFLVWLHLYSERHSLNQAIERSPLLSRLDRLAQGG